MIPTGGSDISTGGSPQLFYFGCGPFYERSQAPEKVLRILPDLVIYYHFSMVLRLILVTPDPAQRSEVATAINRIESFGMILFQVKRIVLTYCIIFEMLSPPSQ